MALPIPVIDIAPFASGNESAKARVVADVADACQSTGFLVVTGHGVPAALTAEMYELTAAFFALPLAEKERCTPVGWDRFCGFASVETGRRPNGRADLKEMFHANRFDSPEQAVAAGYSVEVAAAQAPNLWPTQPAGFEDGWKRYYTAMADLAGRLTRIFAAALGLPEDWFADKLDNHLSNLAANWYPPQPEPPKAGDIRAGAHIDFSVLTILYQDDAPGGLEVRDHSGEWRPVAPLADSYVINLGDLMNRWTNDRWRATLHRVVNPPRAQADRGRISIPYFQMPNWDARIECAPTCLPADGVPNYPAVVAGPHAEQRRSGRRSELVA
jgi:isopenicillin N synthase-like dioxygenase